MMIPVFVSVFINFNHVITIHFSMSTICLSHGEKRYLFIISYLTIWNFAKS